MMASGIAYGGRDEKTKEEKFNHIYSIRIRDVELELSP